MFAVFGAVRGGRGEKISSESEAQNVDRFLSMDVLDREMLSTWTKSKI